jgi:hypothetical protein
MVTNNHEGIQRKGVVTIVGVEIIKINPRTRNKGGR